MTDDKKGIFENLFGKKNDPKAAEEAEKAKKAAAELQRVAEESKRLAEEKARELAAKKEIADEKAKLEAERNVFEAQKRAEEAKAKAQQAAVAAAAFMEGADAAPSILATHTVTADETLSHIALKYYNHATPPYYTLIYEFNKDVIGANMNVIKPGQVLRIPVLPQNLK